jgi:metal-sulfur cluster biosynthetic enzyme
MNVLLPGWIDTALRQVLDPELGIDIVSLGLVHDVRLTDDAVEVDMMLTTPGCPVAEQLPEEAEEVLRQALPGRRVEVRLVWDPPWTPDRIEPGALHALGHRAR